MQQSSSLSSSAENLDHREEEAFKEEYDSVARDLRAKLHAAGYRNSPPPSYHVDEQIQFQLAILRASQENVSGAVVHSKHNSDCPKPSHVQLEQMASFRQIQKGRCEEQHREDDIPEPLSTSEEQPLDNFQGRMNDFRIKEDQRTKMEDEEWKKQKMRRMKWFLLVALLVVAIVVAGIGAGLAVGRGSSVQGVDEIIDDTDEADEAETKAFQECYMRNDTRPSRRFIGMRDTIASAWSWRSSPIDTTGSSERAALCWVAEFDEQNYDRYILKSDLIQRFALASIYYKLAGTTPEVVAQRLSGWNWLSSAHVCTWDFVACDGSNSRVTELFIDGLQGKKSIPEEVTLLSDLVYLKLTNSHLTGQIPSALSFLFQLQVLDLSFNELTGSIPPELGGLVKLRAMQLDQNQLQGKIPHQIFEISQLDHLLLSYNRLTGTLPASFNNATALTTIGVGQNALIGTVPDMSQLTNLEYLGLGDTSIDGAFPNISRLTNLVNLELNAMNLTGTIPSTIWFFPSLLTINLEASFGVSGTIPAAVGLLTNLQTLKLGATKYAGSIPTTLGNLSNLRELSLRGLVDLTGPVPTELARLSSLERLELPTVSKLTGHVPNEICSLRTNGSLAYFAGPVEKCQCCENIVGG